MKLFICGNNGRMSQAIKALAQTDPNMKLLTELEKHCAIIDFTAPAAFEANLELALKNQATYMIGTTGLSQKQLDSLKPASQKIPVLWAPNTSLGANLQIELARISSQILSEFQVSIQDIHHQHKKDAPSGTALALQKAVGRDCEITSSRIGEVAGIHEVLLSSALESLSLKHEVFDRKVFAQGAILASLFLSKQKPGLYTMKDVLGLPQ